MKNHDQAIGADQEKYEEAIHYLFSLQHYGIKFGLSNIRQILALLDNPQESFKAIHIAGTNGKGSTSFLTASILVSAGLTVGLFTSPHLVSFTERIKINGINIGRSDVVSITDHIRSAISNEKGLAPTFFEFVTAMAFYYFKIKGVQWAVVETGMGGRLDSTNVIDPVVSIITRVSMDHMSFLGNSLVKIAGEKAGIIKNGVPVVLGLQEREAEEIILNTASLKQSHVEIYGRDFNASLLKAGLRGTHFDYRSNKEIKGLHIPLCGEFQVENASLAIRALELVQELHLDEGIIRDGLASTVLEGRCELYHWKFPILFDGAHNVDAARNLRKILSNIHLKEYKSIILLIGSMSDKDLEGILEVLLPIARLSVFTTLRFQRAADARELHKIAGRLGAQAIAAGDTVDAFNTLESHYREGDLVVVTGSFYTVGEAKGLIGADSSLIGLTEFR